MQHVIDYVSRDIQRLLCVCDFIAQQLRIECFDVFVDVHDAVCDIPPLRIDALIQRQLFAELLLVRRLAVGLSNILHHQLPANRKQVLQL